MKYTFLCIIFLLCSCTITPHDISKSSNHIIYFKDQRTNICFAYASNFSDDRVLTYVPCTKEVEELLVAYPTGLL